MKKILPLLLFFSFNSNALTFTQAKDELKELYKAYPKTFYCGCSIDWLSKSKLVPDLKSCGYTARKQQTRAERIEFEHIVPAWEFGHQRQCWQNGGRKNCVKTDPIFKEMEGDLYNLVPSVGEVNGDRSNFRYGMIAGEARVYGQCDAEVDFKARVFEPADAIRGDIARTYFYFEQHYKLKISDKQKKLFNAWDKLDPADQTECNIYKAKRKLAPNKNEILEKVCNN